MKILSGIQPSSSSLHLGNYIGSILNWKKVIKNMSANDECLFMIADLHALTSNKSANDLRQNVDLLIATYLACGIEPSENVSFFIQSQIPEHCELCWILSTITPLGQLERMTQFKDKKAKFGENGLDNVNAGLLYYPVLMAGDIMLYQADKVPVGEDQTQHIEFTRDIVQKFNNIYGDSGIFVMPDGMIDKTSKRIMSLGDGRKKMSKSFGESKDTIFLNDTDDDIVKKIKTAKTDSIAGIYFDKENRPEVSNLINIYSALSGISVEEISKQYNYEKSTKAFKDDLTDIIIKELKPIREKFEVYKDDKELLKKIIKEGNDKAKQQASKTMEKVKKAVGLL